MNVCTNILFLSALLVLASLSAADLVEEGGGLYGPRCRNMRTFPFVDCQPQCSTYSLDVHRQCQAKQQFGCLYRRCSQHNFQCALTAEAAASNSCADGEVVVKQVTLRPNFPVEFELAVNLKGADLDVVLLVDASQSARAGVQAVKNELKSFVRRLQGTAHVGVAIYGAEQSLDEKGMRVLAVAQEDVQGALDALDNIPTLPDGVRTSLTALSSIQRFGNELSLRGWRTIVVLIGDSAGREPECSVLVDRDGLSRSLYDHTSGISVIAASVAEPGLDAALPAVEACANGYGPQEPRAVAAGQASQIAEVTKGEVVNSITADALFAAVDRVRRKANRPHQRAPGGRISISTASVEALHQPYYPRLERINGCEDRVIATLSGIPSFVSEPAEVTAKVKLDLPAGICQGGAFTCTVRVLDSVEGSEAMSVWWRPTTYYKKITVRAC